MRPEGWSNVRRLVAIRLDNIGDVVMLGPALRALRRELPDASITLMASPAGAQVAPLLPWIDEVFALSAVWQDASWKMPLDPRREQSLVENMAKRNFDAAIIFTSFSQSPYPPAYVCYLAGIPLRIGQSREFGGSLLTQWVTPPPDSAHQVDRNLHLLAAAGFSEESSDLEVDVPESARLAADALLQSHGMGASERFVLLAPGASCSARRYDSARFAEAMRLVSARSGMRVVIVGNEKERALASEIGEAIGRRTAVSIAGETDIPQLAAVIERASVVVANDSGPMHLADALRRPIVITFSGTELESQWAPRTAAAVLLRRATDCSPCYAFNCRFEMQCLDIPPAEVAETVLRMLDLTPQTHLATGDGARQDATSYAKARS